LRPLENVHTYGETGTLIRILCCGGGKDKRVRKKAGAGFMGPAAGRARSCRPGTPRRRAYHDLFSVAVISNCTRSTLGFSTVGIGLEQATRVGHGSGRVLAGGR
jgi:hypothetical protein